MPFRLMELKASSFRGIAELQLLLEPGLVLVGGPNGSGKSSTLNAIAWALAGKSIAQKKLGVVEIPERKGWQLVRDGARACEVQLLLHDGQRALRVRRSSVRDQCRVEGGSSADDPLAALGLTIDTLISSVFLPQELLRVPVALDPKERGRIFLDLVGLGRLGELEGTLTECVKAARGSVDEIARLRKSIDDQIASQVSLKRRDIDVQREKAKMAGLVADPDARGAADRLVERTRASLAALAERHGAPPPALPEAGPQVDLAAFEKAARECLSRIEASSPDAQKGGELERRRLAVAALQEEGRSHDAKRRELAAEREDLARSGSDESLRGQKAALEADLARLQEEIARASAQGELLDKALGYFQTLAQGPEPLACPVCDTRPIDLAHVREHLRRSLDRAGIDPLRRKKAEAERAVRDVEALLERHARLHAAVEAHSKRVDDLRRRAGDLRGQALSAAEDVSRVLQAILDAVQRELDEAHRRIAERGKDVQKVRDELEGVAVVRRIQDDRHALERLDALPSEPAYRELKEQEHHAHVLFCVAEGLRAALKEERKRAFDEAFTSVQDDVVRWFRRITDRPDCTSLRIDSEKWSILEGSSQGEREVTATFNLGDLTSVALAVFLATASRAAHGAGFVLLDDPTQGLDDDHKRRLAEALAEMAGERQVVVASADEVFLSALERAGTASRIVHRLRVRAPGRGCELEESR